jgi:predicted nucleic acid-binding protein
MISVLLDTNVVLDYAEEREGFFEMAEKIFEMVKQKKVIGCVSASAVTDIFYFLLKRYKYPDFVISLLKKLIRILKILAVDNETIDTAIESGMLDFEDAVQAVAAQDFGIDIVVTRDKTGFQNSGMHVYSPEEFLEMLA